LTSINLCICGEAGQGLVTIGQLLAKCLVRAGYHIVVTQSYQSRIRGGHNAFFIRVGASPITAPVGPIDLLVPLNEESIEIHRGEMAADGWIFRDADYGMDGDRNLPVPYASFGGGIYVNIAAFAVTGCLLGLDTSLMEGMVREAFGKKGDAASEKNLSVLARTVEWAKNLDIDFKGLPAPASPSRRMMVNGNEAIALGAVAAGVRCGFFYPMTPATSIILTLIKHAREAGIVMEQAEDEIAAVNMAIGASFCGARSMVATSGGGYALMTEGVSLAAMTETPLVIAIAQRPGPATGLPTRTEQGDLEFVLHGGHGEFPRAVFAPGDVTACFALTVKAFDVAEASQGPVFILTDQFLADSYRAVEPFTWPEATGNPAERDREISPEDYQRYALTDDGVSPRAFPGQSGALVVADSDEHTEAGHITEDLRLRPRMVRKRLRKMARIREAVVPPVFSGDASPELLFVCWGSTMGAVEEAVETLRREGRRAAMLHFSQVWPLRPGDFMDTLESAEKVVAVEGNATSQFARLIRRETGFAITRHVNRYDGLPITPGFILDGIARMGKGV